MAPPGGKDLTLTVHGLEHMGTQVYADVAAKQFRDLMRGLRAIDRELNGARGHEFVVADMRMGSAVFAIRELPSRSASAESPSRVLASSGRQISLGSASPSSVLPVVAKTYENLTADLSTRFRYSTLDAESDRDNIVRIDDFFQRRLIKLERQRQDEIDSAKPKYFVGHAWGAFQGEIQEFDIRNLQTNLLPAGHFILAAGNHDIDCIFYADIDEVRAAFGQRVVVEGQAIYDGTTGLPARIEIRHIKPVVGESMALRRGTVAPYVSPEDSE